jgi:hypothetical protein
MFDNTTTFTLHIFSADRKTANAYAIVGMRMNPFPNTTIKEITIIKDTIEQTVDFDPMKMAIIESPNDGIVKVRIHGEKVQVVCNRLMNNIEVLGIIEIGKTQINKGIADQPNMITAAKN